MENFSFEIDSRQLLELDIVDIDDIVSEIKGERVLKRKQSEAIDFAGEKFLSGLKIKAIVKTDKILKVDDEKVTLSSNNELKGKLPVSLLEKSDYVISYVLSVVGFDDVCLNIDDMLSKYFFDWIGSSCAIKSHRRLYDIIVSKLKELELSYTIYWNPGQFSFPLENQVALFDILKPDEIGFELSSTYQIMPTKSVSGIIAVSKGEQIDFIPCSLCENAKYCKSYMNFKECPCYM